MLKKTTNEIRYTAHSSYRCQYHIVIVPKYRIKEVYGTLKKDSGISSNTRTKAAISEDFIPISSGNV